VRELPEVAEAVRVIRAGDWRPLISYGQTQFYKEVYLADANFFEVFAFPLLRGSPERVLQNPNSIAISSEIARLYFGDENPLGKRLMWDISHEYVVTGIFERPPNTHFDLDLIGSLSTLTAEPSFGALDLDDWKVRPPVLIYVVLEEGAEVEGLGQEILDLGVEQVGLDFWRKEYDSSGQPFSLQSVRDIHLHSHFQREYRNNSDIDYIYLTAGLAFFLLLMSCINFTNLATARSVYRSREVGLRKVVGAYRTHLLGQFLGESVLIAFVALLLALALVWAVTPIFGAFVDRPLALYFDVSFVSALLFLTLLCGLAAGAYPALFLSSHRPTQALKSTARARSCAGDWWYSSSSCPLV